MMSRSACLCANLCRAFYLLSFCSFEDIIASWFYVSIAHYSVPYHFILKIKQNRIFKINDVGHNFFLLSLYLQAELANGLNTSHSEAYGFHYSKKNHWLQGKRSETSFTKDPWDVYPLPPSYQTWQACGSYFCFKTSWRVILIDFWNSEIPSIRLSSLASFSKIQKMKFLGWHEFLWALFLLQPSLFLKKL